MTGCMIANTKPLAMSDQAERYTDDRTPNFDIFLPRWLARSNKQISTALLVA